MRTLGKLIITLIAIIAGALIAFLAVPIYKARSAKTMDELITSSLTFDNPECTWPSSVEVSFRNNGNEDIDRIRWSFSANEKGHSSELVKPYSLRNHDYNFTNQWSTDLIIQPGKTITVCSPYPLPDEDLTLDKLDIRLHVIELYTPSNRYNETNPHGYL